MVTRSTGTGADGFSFLQLIDVALDALGQCLAGRAEIGAHRVAGVVGRVDGLGRILRVGRVGRRRPAVEIFVVGERPDRSAPSRPPCRPSRSGCLAPDTGRSRRQCRSSPADRASPVISVKRDEQDDGGANFFQHDGSPQARCKAVTARSMALMPTNGRMMPPSAVDPADCGAAARPRRSADS